MRPYVYQLADAVDVAEAEMSLDLATIAVEGLFGRAAAKMDARSLVDPPRRTIAIDRSTPEGDALARIFTELLRREFGEESFTVRHVPVGDVPRPASTPARRRATRNVARRYTPRSKGAG